MNPRALSVRILCDYCLDLVFENGERRVFDVKPYLGHGVFVRLQNRSVFQAARVVAGSVEWPGDVDLSYDTLYLESETAKPAVEDSRVPTLRDAAAQYLASTITEADGDQSGLQSV